VNGKPQGVTGRAWLDHEWSSELLPDEAQGWDWIGVNLDDGSALMAFRMRDPHNRALWSAASIRQDNGRVETLPAEAVAFEPLRHWRSSRTGLT
jgi:predicted secreted hydrolase